MMKVEKEVFQMVISELLAENDFSQYRLSKETGIGKATISDICSGKTSMKKCSAGTLYKIAHALGTTVDALIEAENQQDKEECRPSFSTFRSNVCHYVKDMGDVDFIIDTLEKNKIRMLYDKAWYPEAFYLLAMLDYLSKLNGLPICKNYNDIRSQKLAKPLYSSDVLIQSSMFETDNFKQSAKENAIPEFSRFNIMEGAIRNVV